MQKIKTIVKSKTQMVIVILFLVMKIFLGMIELPHYNKTSSQIPYLLIVFILIILCIGLKFFLHKQQLFRKLLHIQMQSFLLWIITIIYIIFIWSLCDALGWNLFQKVMMVLCQILQTFLITLMLDAKFITKVQFVGFQTILGSFIMALAVKTVGFIKDDSQSAHKDIVLLNLSTQIALAIILMDYIQKSYSKMKTQQTAQDMSRIQNQLVIIK